MTGRSEADAPLVALDGARARGELPPGAHLLLALSGGCDSASLLHALHHLGAWRLSAAVVDHGLHPTSAQRAARAAAHAHELGVPTVVLRAGIMGETSRDGPEASARAARYRALRAHAAAIDAIYIVTAHTADDQAETVLMRLAEGTGLRGVAGIPHAAAGLRRPWLGVTRAAVRAYASSHGVPVVEDPTNEDRRFLRNALRHAVLPAMDGVFAAGWTARASRSVRHARGAVELLDHLLRDASHLIRRRGEQIELPREGLQPLTSAARAALVDRALASALGGGRRRRRHVDALIGLAPGEVWTLPGGWVGRATRDAIVLEPSAPLPEPSPSLSVPGPGLFEWSGWRFEVVRGHGGDDSSSVALDIARAPFPWVVRCGRDGERMRPRAAPGSKRLRRLWAEAGWPVRWRRVLPVIESAGRPIWAAGLRAAEHVRVELDAPAWRLRVVAPTNAPRAALPRHRAR